MNTASDLSCDVGRKPACEALGVPRATFYRHMERKHYPSKGNGIRTTPPLALTLVEKQTVVDVLHSERFQDKTPYEVYATGNGVGPR